MKHSSRSPLGYYTIGVAALFLAGFFLLVVFGAQSYRNTVAGQSANNQTRALLSYFETAISASDHKGDVHVEDTDYGQVLVVPDGTSGYGLRIFCYEGSLMDEYARLDSPLMPEQDAAIARTETFQVIQPEEDLFEITTDAGTILVHLRGGHGEATLQQEGNGDLS